MMPQDNLPQEWEELVYETCKNSISIAYGVFNLSGKLTYANKTMSYYLDADNEDLNPKNKFINLDLTQLTNSAVISELVFEGLLTIGNAIDKHYALNAKVFKRNNTFLVYAEADVLNLFEENQLMSRLNQQVNNLQRELIKEKRTLQQTLKKLKEMQQMLIHSEKMNALGQMIAGVAHEINNPMAFVTNNLYELDNYTKDFIKAYQELESGIKNDASSEIQDFVKSVRTKNEVDYLTEDIGALIVESKSGVERVKTIVEDLRKFSRLDESDLKRINLIENIRSTLTIIKSEIDKKEIQFIFDCPSEIILDCFPGQLNQAILNVLINAIQAVNNQGEISLTIKEASKNVVIIVEDNGIGMNKEDVGKMFDPFFTKKPVGTGTGIGLSITYKIINELHKGKIDVESVINKGTLIKFIIPKEIAI